MIRATLIAAAVLVPAMAAAQDPTPRAAAAAPEGLVLPASFAEAAAAAVQPPAPRGPRRRPSMVGYIDDSTLGSQVRIRFDAGWGINAPDRAEFFYAKCGCYRDLPPNHALFDPEAAGPGPGILNDLRFQQLYLMGEYGIADRASVYAELPIRFLRPQVFEPGTGSFGDTNGISDLRMGVKASLYSTDAAQVTFRFQAVAPTGDSLKGLGTDHWSIEPALLYAQQVTDDFGLEAQFGDIIPTDGSPGIPASSDEKFAGNILYWGVGPHYVVFRNDQVSIAPVVELVGWHVLGGFQTTGFIEADGINVVNLKIGGRIGVNDRSSIYVGFGHALTDDVWYDDILRLEYRVGF